MGGPGRVGLWTTDLTATIDAPKEDPARVAQLAVDGIETARSPEIFADAQQHRHPCWTLGGVAAFYPQPGLNIDFPSRIALSGNGPRAPGNSWPPLTT